MSGFNWHCCDFDSLTSTLRFAAGRHTALVVDIGKQTASVLPVVEGFVLRKGS